MNCKKSNNTLLRSYLDCINCNNKFVNLQSTYPQINMADEDNGTKRPKTEEAPAVTRFREYLRIKTVQPDPDYGNKECLDIK